MWKLSLLVPLFLALSVAGCIQAPVVPPTAAVYTQFQAPLDVDFDRTTLGTKTGESDSICILGLVAVGDASVRAAARKGGLSIIHGADYSYTNVLGIYQSYSTIVYGE